MADENKSKETPAEQPKKMSGWTKFWIGFAVVAVIIVLVVVIGSAGIN